MAISNQIRVRFAPSPTGYLHVGGLRTALYNYLFAKKNNGVFILRIEDTDRARYVEGAVEKLINTLHQMGLDYDEGPLKGELGPYVQSDRLNLYREHVAKLLEQGSAYRCFCTPERLDAMRKELQKQSANPKYDRTCLRLSQYEIDGKLKNGEPYVVRMKVPNGTVVKFNDLIRDNVEFSSDLIDDQVLLKTDGYPTYHLANVVDDHYMQVTHVIRGEEWLPSTPKHVLLYQAFGWEMPQFAHLPLLLNPDRSKLSKRQGDVAVEDYLGKGYLEEALLNFVALLGWNPGGEQEIFSLHELVNLFSLEQVNKAGAIFNVEKLDWLNFEHLKRKSDAELLTVLKKKLASSKYASREFADEYLLQVIAAMRPRASFVKDFIEKCSYFYEPPSEYDPEVVKKRWTNETPKELKFLADEYSTLNNPSKEEYETALHHVSGSLHIGNGKLIHEVRLAVSGSGTGPGVYDILAIIGKDESIRRIKTAIYKIKT
ncbi:MAG: glutamate--tRNA ligase [Bacteroidota bacterium]